MARITKNTKVNKIITSAKKSFFLALITATGLSTVGCAKNVKNAIETGKEIVETVGSGASTVSEKMKDFNEKTAEKIDKVDKITIPSLFSEKKSLFAGSDETGYYDEEGNKVGTFSLNTLLNIVGISDDGAWYKTAEGFFVKVTEMNEKPITHVIKCEQTVVYAQYNNVKVHSEPDKSSSTITTLPVNQPVAKTGEVEFANGTEVSKIDSTGDHGWSEVMFKMNGEAKTGYIYSDYIGASETTTTKAAIEAPSYTDSEKEALVKEAKEYGIVVDINSSDETLYEKKQEVNAAKSAKAQAESSSTYEKLMEEMNKIAEAGKKAEEESKKQSGGSTASSSVNTQNEAARIAALNAEHDSLMTASWLDGYIHHGGYSEPQYDSSTGHYIKYNHSYSQQAISVYGSLENAQRAYENYLEAQHYGIATGTHFEDFLSGVY